MASSSAVKFQGLGFPSTTWRKSSYVFWGHRLKPKIGLPLLNLSKKNSNMRRNCVPIIKGKIVGIDLGTTNSAVAAIVDDKPTIITKIPSVVAYTKNGDLLVGEIAERQALLNPENTFSSVKRFIGRNISEVDEESKQVSYRVVWENDAENGNVKIECPAIGKQLTPEDISAQIMRKLVDDASKFLNEKVSKAVVAVPSYFNDFQRRAIMDAGRIAGIEILRIISEPVAASVAFKFEEKDGMILIFDLGGGTFDVSVHEVGLTESPSSIFGDTHLGGDDFDKRIVDWLAESFKRDEGIDLLKDKQALQCLTVAAEKAKTELSFSTQANISIPFMTETVDGPERIETILTRDKFEELCSDLFGRLKVAVENSLTDARLAFDKVDEVILVGGSTHIPAVQELVKKLTGKDPNVSANYDEKVALGAAIQAGLLFGDVSDPYPFPPYGQLSLSLGLETSGGVMVKLISKYQRLPYSVSEVFTTIADGQTSIAIHVLQGESKLVRDNKSLGSFHINGICPAPRGVPKVEVEFNIDEDGIVSVAAFDEGTGKKLDISVTGGRTLTNVRSLVKYYESMIWRSKKYQITYGYDTINKKLSQFI